MEKKPEEIDARMKHFDEVCKAAGVKLTHQRIEIFREVAQNSTHPDAESIYKGVHRRIPTISLDTVYRTLWLLKDLGLIHTLGASRERTRFDANLDRHHHFICSRCGATHDFYSRELDELDIARHIKNLGQADSLQINVQGVCSDCSGGKQA